MKTITPKPLLPLKWAGSKAGTPVADRVRELFEPYRDTHLWVEPFVGAGGMLFSVDPERACCIDWSLEIITLHKWLKDEPTEVRWDWSPEQYYEARKKFWDLQLELVVAGVDPDEFCPLMIWLNRACFNGLWRVNGMGFFNVPQGKNSAGGLLNPAMPDLQAISKQYRPEWSFWHNRYEQAERFVDENSFTYIDPPYNGTHSDYTGDGFEWVDQVDLADWLAELPGVRVASNAARPEIIKLYEDRGFDIELIEVRRSISSKGAERKPALEMLAIKGVQR